jgi:Glycosyltransferase family 87
MRSQTSGDSFGCVSRANSELVVPDRHSRQLLWGLFIFFYIPIAYYYGWTLLSGISVDFPTYYHAARLAFVEGKTPYGFTTFDAISAEMGRRVHPYLYPPPSLLAFWPLAKLSLASGQAAFLVVSHLCYLGSIWLMLDTLTPLPADQRRREITLGLSLVYLLCFDPALATLAIGQINLIALFFICLALAALKRGSSAWCIALPLSAAILLKTYPVLLLPLLAFRRQFRAIALTCVFFGIYTAIAALALPGEIWTSWFHDILPAGGYANNQIAAAGPWNQSINGFVSRLLLKNDFCSAPLAHPFLAKPVATVLALMVVGLTLFFSFRLSKQGGYQRSGDDEISAFLLMIFLIAPLSWDHHLVYVLPAALLAISLIVNGSTGGKVAVTLAAALFLTAWRIPFDHPALMHGWWTLLISVKFYPVTVLWLFFVRRLHRSGSEAAGQEIMKVECPQARR